jgi:hypothetical protein
MNATPERQLSSAAGGGRLEDEWEQLRDRWYDVSGQYRRRAISERDLTKQLSVVVSMQLEVLRRHQRHSGARGIVG